MVFEFRSKKPPINSGPYSNWLISNECDNSETEMVVTYTFCKDNTQLANFNNHTSNDQLNQRNTNVHMMANVVSKDKESIDPQAFIGPEGMVVHYRTDSESDTEEIAYSTKFTQENPNEDEYISS